MASLETNKTWIDSPYIRFLGGAFLGSFLILLPLLYSDIHSLAQVTGLQLGLAVLVMLTCGTLAAKLGLQFIDAVMKGLDNSGF